MVHYISDLYYIRNFSNILLANTIVFNELATTDGAKNKPFKYFVFWPIDGPISFPSPVSLSATRDIKSFLPTTYAPLVAIPAPKFFINEPTAMSAPTYIGSFSVTNSQ